MGSKNHIEITLKDGATIQDLPGLSLKLATDCEFDPTTAGPNYTDFVVVDAKNNVLFYQGAAGEDEDDDYAWRLRIYVAGRDMAQHFADHLASGSFVLTYRPEGDAAEVFVGTPGDFQKIN